MRGNTLFVQGLSPLTRAKDLAKEFQKVGILTRCDIPMSKGISKRYGFVEFREEVAANEAIRIFMNTRVDGHLISVEHARAIPSYEWTPAGSIPPHRSRSPPRRPLSSSRRSLPRVDPRRGMIEREDPRRYHNTHHPPPPRYRSPPRGNPYPPSDHYHSYRSREPPIPRKHEYPRSERSRDREWGRDRSYTRSPGYERSSSHRKRRRTPPRDSPPRKYSRGYH
uniref:RRM domain-containing protein n=1 Tax=Vannella robusta TaxID=1487602 RepID=A0A7S4I1C6_9EUKA|mmetsp:Transcript_18823/g.23851  ORF Transcript_18823/g.23851 Transcript_18823/m.23851 type:complete len:223 (+) Transcript_18823:64-732(+)